MQAVQLRLHEIVEARGRSNAYWKRLCDEAYLTHVVDPATNEVTITLEEVDRFLADNTVEATD